MTQSKEKIATTGHGVLVLDGLFCVHLIGLLKYYTILTSLFEF